MLSGSGFGPIGSKFVSGAYGGVTMAQQGDAHSAAAAAAPIVTLFNCTVTMPNVEARCRTPASFGVSYGMVLTSNAQSSAQSATLLSYALPRIDAVIALGPGANSSAPLRVRSSVLQLRGSSLGGQGVLLLNNSSTVGAAAADPDPSHMLMQFTIPQLPLALVGQSLVALSVRILGITTNVVAVHAAGPIVTASDPASRHGHGSCGVSGCWRVGDVLGQRLW